MLGYTEWLNSSFLETAFPGENCVCVGRRKPEQLRQIRFINEDDLKDRAAIRVLLTTWEFDEIVFFSHSLGLFRDITFEELSFLSDLMEEAQSLSSPKIIILSGVNRQHTGSPMEEQLIEGSMKTLTDNCIRQGLNCMFISVPWVYSIGHFGDSLSEWIRSSNGTKTLAFPFSSSQEIRMIASGDLAEFLYHLRDRWVNSDDSRTFSIGIPMKAKELGDKLLSLLPDFTCNYDETPSVRDLPAPDASVRSKYSWFQQHTIIGDLTELWDQFSEKGDLSQKSSRAEEMPRIFRILKGALELLVGFAIMEGLLRLSGVQVQFRLIDFRLLYVCIFGLMYNIPMGLSAAALASLSLILGYSSQGISGLTLFYEPTNWFAFIVYFLVGAACGYIRQKDRDNLAFAAAESKLLREKYHFLREMFLESQQEKHEYRQQILNSQDSFGKIFRITRELDVISPHLIFMHAMSVIEEIMNNKTVTIYSVGKNQAFARLEAASRNLDARRSLSLDAYGEVIAKVREDGIWTNTQVLPDMPMYVCGVTRDDDVVLLVMLWRADFGQMSLYYSNLLKILCGLISTSLLRSLDYRNLTHDSRYFEGTLMMKPESFLEEITTASSMNQAKIASYTLHYLTGAGMAPKKISETIEHRIRENDVFGLVGDTLYLLISQSTPEGIGIMRDRFEKMGITLHDADFEEVIRLLTPDQADPDTDETEAAHE